MKISLGGSARQDLSWRKASASAGCNACVEVADADGVIFVRDSKDPDGLILGYKSEVWASFCDDIKRGAFDGLA